MNTEELIKQARKIIESAQKSSKMELPGVLSEAKEFLRVYAGEKSTFFKEISEIRLNWEIDKYVVSYLEAFIRYVGNGLFEGVSIERKAQIDVVSDFLGQANTLLGTKEVHPAAPTVIVGAALEEFLRNWIEEAGLDLKGKKPGLDSYARVLREADLITKQDDKDITSWGGLRNHAAHGEWDEVSDRSRVSIMLEGVNLFMRKYGERET